MSFDASRYRAWALIKNWGGPGVDEWQMCQLIGVGIASYELSYTNPTGLRCSTTVDYENCILSSKSSYTTTHGAPLYGGDICLVDVVWYGNHRTIVLSISKDGDDLVLGGNAEWWKSLTLNYPYNPICNYRLIGNIFENPELMGMVEKYESILKKEDWLNIILDNEGGE